MTTMPEIPTLAAAEADPAKIAVFEHSDLVNEPATSGLRTVAFEENDLENPRNWGFWQKWSIVASISSMSFLSIFAPAAIVPAAPQVLQTFHINSGIYRTLLVTIWELGTGVSPFFIAPLAERFGRLPIYHIGNLLSLVCAVAGALSTNLPMLISFRFLNGFVLPVGSIGPAMIADLFGIEQRGFIMSVTFAFIVLADFVSPLIGAEVATTLGWRWILWLNAIAFGIFGSISLLLVRETYAEKILKRKACRLRSQGGPSCLSNYQEPINTTVILGITRPIQILTESPIVFVISLCTAVMYGLLSLVFATLTEVMESTYLISPASVGLTFLSLAIGNLLATILYGFTSDRNIEYQKRNKGNEFQPEARLVHLLWAAILLTFGFLLYGWTAEFHAMYIVPLVGVSIGGAGLTFALLATETYLVDIYEMHGASAIAAGITLRTVFATVLPLGAPALYQKLGLGWGNSVLALIAAILVPVLSLVMKYGERFRSKGTLAHTENF